MTPFDRLRAWAATWFPERHLYLRQGGEMRAFVLSGRKQMIAAGGFAATALWMGVCTAAMAIAAFGQATADRPARSVTDVQGGAETAEALATQIERRHAALALLLTDVAGSPGAAETLAPPLARATTTGGAGDAVLRLRAVRASQDEVLAIADAFAASRAERLRTALRLTGVNPAAALQAEGPSGGPLIAPDGADGLVGGRLDPGFASRLQSAAEELAEAKLLDQAVSRLPVAAPIAAGSRTSGFGFRFDPFTGRAAFHAGIDYAGARMTPVQATAAGMVSFTGVRAGYGRMVEVDHGGGFKTRYAHLASIGVKPGQQIAAGARLGGMGSTGRSTGTHLHYEVWRNGRAQNPERFVRAGYALQGG